VTDSEGRATEPVFPTHLFVYEMGEFFAAELLGASAEYATIIPNRIDLDDLDNFLGNFGGAESVGGASIVAGGGTGQRIIGHNLYFASHIEQFRERYPVLVDFREPSIIAPGTMSPEVGNALRVRKEGPRDIWLDDVLTMSTFGNHVRIRYFQKAWIVHRTITSSELLRQLQCYYPTGGVNLLPPAARKGYSHLIAAANFATLSAVDKFVEVTITQFIERNSDLLSLALGGVSYVPQPRLPWIE
jgi:hypothetical protein